MERDNYPYRGIFDPLVDPSAEQPKIPTPPQAAAAPTSPTEATAPPQPQQSFAPAEESRSASEFPPASTHRPRPVVDRPISRQEDYERFMRRMRGDRVQDQTQDRDTVAPIDVLPVPQSSLFGIRIDPRERYTSELPAINSKPNLSDGERQPTLNDSEEDDDVTLPLEEDAEPWKWHEVVMVALRRRPIIIAGIAAVALTGGVVGGKTFIDHNNEVAMQMIEAHPSLTNEWLPECGTGKNVEAITLSVSGTAEVRIPVQLANAAQGHSAYLLAQASPNLFVKAGLCGERGSDHKPRDLATFNPDSNSYEINRKAAGLYTPATSSTGAPNITGNPGLGRPNSLYVDGKKIDDPTKYPFSDATNKMLATLITVNTDPKTKQANGMSYTQAMNTLYGTKLVEQTFVEMESQCSSLSAGADKFLSRKIAAMALEAESSSQKADAPVFADGSRYGSMAYAFQSEKVNKPYLDSKTISVDNLTISCSLASPPPSSATPRQSSQTTTNGVKP